MITHTRVYEKGKQWFGLSIRGVVTKFVALQKVYFPLLLTIIRKRRAKGSL